MSIQNWIPIPPLIISVASQTEIPPLGFISFQQPAEPTELQAVRLEIIQKSYKLEIKMSPQFHPDSEEKFAEIHNHISRNVGKGIPPDSKMRFDNGCLSFFSMEYKKAAFIVDSDVKVSGSLTGLEYFLHYTLQFFLPCMQSILFHAASCRLDNRGCLFVADSGGGKSTIVSLLENQVVLNDDFSSIQHVDNLIFSHATPLGSKTDGPGSTEITALFVLEKAREFKITRVEDRFPYIQASWHWHARSYSYLPRQLRSNAFKVMANLFYKVPVYELHFHKDYIDQDQIEDVLKGTHPICRKKS